MIAWSAPVITLISGCAVEHVLGRLEALRGRVERLALGDDLDVRVDRRRLVERLLQRLVERGGLDRPDVAHVARVGVGAGRDDELADLAAELARDEHDVRQLALDLEVRGGVVGAEDLVDVADRDAGVDGGLGTLDESRAVDRLQDDPVVLARCHRVLQQLHLGAGVELAVHDVKRGVVGRRRGLGRLEHRRVVAVLDRERDVGELERIVVEPPPTGSPPARWPPRSQRRWPLRSGAAALCAAGALHAASTTAAAATSPATRLMG